MNDELSKNTRSRLRKGSPLNVGDALDQDNQSHEAPIGESAPKGKPGPKPVFDDARRIVGKIPVGTMAKALELKTHYSLYEDCPTMGCVLHEAIELLYKAKIGDSK